MPVGNESVSLFLKSNYNKMVEILTTMFCKKISLFLNQEYTVGVNGHDEMKSSVFPYPKPHRHPTAWSDIGTKHNGMYS